jgi:hypothetical protein
LLLVAGCYRLAAIVLEAARLVGINTFRTECDGIERIGTDTAFGVTQGTA